MIDRQLELHATLRRGRFDLPRLLELPVLHERSSDVDAARLEEGVRHCAADEQSVHPSEHVLDHVDLVGHFRAAEDRDERPLGRLQRVAEILQLLLHQQPRRGPLHEMRDGLHRRVRAVRGAERVVHVAIGELGELLREGGIVLLFLRMKAEVLEQHELSVARAVRLRHRAARLAADAVGREEHRPLEEIREAVGHRPEAHIGDWFALRPSEVAREDNGSALVERVANRRQRRADARVVTDDAALERHVEVDADEDALPSEIQIPDRELHSPFFTSVRSRSTQRFE